MSVLNWCPTLIHSLNLSLSRALIISVDADVDASSLLSNIHGYGAFGLTFMECMELADPATNSSSSSSSDGVVDGSSSTTESVGSDESTNSSNAECTAIRTVLSVYNRVVVGPVLALLPPSRLVAHAADRNQRLFDTPLRALLPGSGSAEEVLQRMRRHERHSYLHAD